MEWLSTMTVLSSHHHCALENSKLYTLPTKECLRCVHVLNPQFFWPGMTPAIIATREHCSSCNRMAPSQPNAPPTPPIQPAYPFQCLVADYFHHCGHNYLVAIGQYSNWPIVEETADGSNGVITALRRICHFWHQ